MKSKQTLAIIASTLIFMGCSSDKPKKVLIGGELLREVSAQAMKDELIENEWPIEGMRIYGYKAYKISYVTTDEKDTSVNVSGLLVIPTNLSDASKKDGLSLISNGHGTITHNDDAPTVTTKKDAIDGDTVIFSVMHGFATLEADYIGYGDSLAKHHPYMMKKSLANSSIDLITAAKKFAKNNNIKINEKLFVTGYSEGGYTAMSTLKKLEERNIPVTASAPMAGAYNLVDMADSVLFDLKDESLDGYEVAYNALIINAYTKNYDKNISTIINEPYASQIDELLDGQHTFEQITNALPSSVVGKDGLFRAKFIEDYHNDNANWLKVAFKENSVHDWKPRTPLRLYHCQGDNQVPYSSSQRTYDKMLANGVKNIALIRPDKIAGEIWDHEDCNFPAILSAASWFVEMRDK